MADNSTLLALIRAGHGVSIVPELLLGELVAEPAGVVIADEHLGVQRTILAVHRNAASRFVAPLLDLLRASTGRQAPIEALGSQGTG